MCITPNFIFGRSRTQVQRTGQGRLKKEVLLTTLLLKPTATAVGARSRWIFFFLTQFVFLLLLFIFPFFFFYSFFWCFLFFYFFFFTIGIVGATTMQSRWGRQALSRELISIIQTEWRWRRREKYQIKSNKDFVRSFSRATEQKEERTTEKKRSGGEKKSHNPNVMCVYYSHRHRQPVIP